MVDIRLLVDSRNHLGEGPLWDVEEQRLYWIDSSAAEIWSCTADGDDAVGCDAAVAATAFEITT